MCGIIPTSAHPMTCKWNRRSCRGAWDKLQKVPKRFFSVFNQHQHRPFRFWRTQASPVVVWVAWPSPAGPWTPPGSIPNGASCPVSWGDVGCSSTPGVGFCGWKRQPLVDFFSWQKCFLCRKKVNLVGVPMVSPLFYSFLKKIFLVDLRSLKMFYHLVNSHMDVGQMTQNFRWVSHQQWWFSTFAAGLIRVQELIWARGWKNPWNSLWMSWCLWVLSLVKHFACPLK